MNSNDEKVDIHIGRRIQLRRNMLGLTQKALAKTCGVTFQQIQKYESAGNRVSASRLFQIGQVLDTPAAFFYFGLPGQQAAIPAEFQGIEQPVLHLRVAEPKESDPLLRSDSLVLINLYWKLPEDQQKTVMNLLRSLVGTGGGTPATHAPTTTPTA